ncbi:Shedu anti-phage system protein SduA domain-containing protein [Mucilaginibacter sp. OK098]|uniref:Shedu anti-phage system protein SduA domain-containing protein n=1 Tax=Mucilaginibacter sp. OK098 TaxID=1855297 RepID=UPI000910E705|nr:Shedu anti-phage system protein SduA domain-containing protein [Mucilaginibacter sp. OK098]SHN35195.1 protein of unknown function [Mucilaginibacter sp. OK098]
MKILINDSIKNKERLVKIFLNGGYERNNLIFVHSFDECKVFFENQLEKEQVNIDLIITNNNNEGGPNPFQATSLVLLKNSLNSSYSNRSFRINSIPIILYSTADDKSDLKNSGFDAIVKKNEGSEHPYFIRVVEEQIRKWREKLIIDLDNIGLPLSRYPYFKNKPEEQGYFKFYGHNFEKTFTSYTSILSKEFIAQPKYLDYDWLRMNSEDLESAISGFRKMYLYHIKYDRKNNERTIIHRYIQDNKTILERDVYSSHLYEQPLYQIKSSESQICDFILQPNMPNYQDTTFFEVKKEDVQLMVKKTKKRPQFSSDMHSHLYQISDYQSYSQSPGNLKELSKKLGYKTRHFSYQLLAGRSEEKEEIKDVFSEHLEKHFSGIEVLTFEEFEELNHTYISKFSRLKV